MGDNDRDTRDTRDTVERERTTIVDTGGDRGSGGLLAVVLLIIALLVLLFLFRDQLGFGGSQTEIEVPEEIDVTVNQ